MQLVVRFVVVKAGLKVPLPVAVRREGIARGLTAAGVKLDQLLRHLLGGFFHLGAALASLVSRAIACAVVLYLLQKPGCALRVDSLRAMALYKVIIVSPTSTISLIFLLIITPAE